MHGQWFNFLYHYGVGGSFYLFTLFFFYRWGGLRWERPSDRNMTKGLVAGLLLFALTHAVWISWAISHQEAVEKNATAFVHTERGIQGEGE